MVASIQGYTPTQQAGVPTQGPALNSMDRVTSEQLNRPGLYSLDQAVMADIGIQPPKEHHGVFHALGKFITEALVVGAVAVGARKGLFHNIKGVDSVEEGVNKLIEPAKDAKFVDKAKYYYAKYTDLAYDKTVGKVLKHLKDKKAEKKDAAASTGATEATGAPAEGENINTQA